MRNGLAFVAAALATTAVAGCGGSGTTTVVPTKTVDTSARIADFKEEGDDFRPNMIAWFENEMCGDRSGFACRCYSDRINWLAGSADDYENLVINLINGERRANEIAEGVNRRCEALTSDAVMAALNKEIRDGARIVIAQAKRATGTVLGERFAGPRDDMTCAEWEDVPRSVRRVLARSIYDGAAWDALHARDRPTDIIAAIDLGCDEYPGDEMTGWLAAEMVLASGGESLLP